ncbi:Succinate-CoA ligase subunit beta [Fasciolopsis buskii]|uniref:Succinate--CoA ligase [ADP-forming] subunit beta, mitochondrial n=1 Tax=Fasciolopsis buskii TaxID=27845 RepID=A0A8E0VPU5_9TREM|nr:Succinate-CoA ligase subunit beta [Fasciolopsis buski]
MLSNRGIGFRRCVANVFGISKRHLNLQEYQCKKLMSDYNVNVQRFMMVREPADVDKIRSSFKVREFVIKAQILAGGRGKGVFRDGFKGGVHLTKDPNAMAELAQKMLGNYLVTKQTPPNGVLVNNVMVAEALDIERETYLAILMDRENGCPIIVACKQGGMEIEQLAEECPDAIMRDLVDVNMGVTEKQSDRIADFLGFKRGSSQFKEASEQIRRLYKMFTALDCLQIEVNPFGETPDGRVVSFDAKLMFDQNAVFRQPEVCQMAAEVEAIEVAAAGPQSTVALESEATKLGLNYIGMPEGNIGCIVNGAGLAMATMDLINYHGGKPANFLDLGGGVSSKQVEAAFQLLTRDPRVKCILINIFGGIVNCNTVAEGLMAAFKKQHVSVPVVVRLEGTNSAQARKTLGASNIGLIPAETLDKAASLAVSKVK